MLFTTIAAIMLFYSMFLTKLPHASSSIPKHRWRVKQSPIKAFVGNNSNVWSLSPSSFKSTKPPNIYFQSNYNGMNFHTTTSRIKILPIQQHKSKRCTSSSSHSHHNTLLLLLSLGPITHFAHSLFVLHQALNTNIHHADRCRETRCRYRSRRMSAKMRS